MAGNLRLWLAPRLAVREEETCSKSRIIGGYINIKNYVATTWYLRTIVLISFLNDDDELYFFSAKCQKIHQHLF